ncbi:uncharacterized protein (TIGR03086 family) [Streptosporangium album]|uniref:Uncharacterized protein (TIGR03086 family) n=2 Tax=Streptosporangium album TaxID=47479 RepID=A0A7W7RR84_9ACTN|nr:uncharacterized protein (TIGR03086 family) [Streptosporangium album]
MAIDTREAYRRALDHFGALVHQIKPEHWGNQTPCVDWDVRALVNHVVGESRWASQLLAGRTVADVGDAFDGDLLGDDPVKAFDISATAAAQAVGGERSLTRVVHLSFGDVPGEEYVTELFADALIHTWDLARAIGADERLDPELVEACAIWSAYAKEGGDRQAAAAGEHRQAASDADPQARLLASWGRRG